MFRRLSGAFVWGLACLLVLLALPKHQPVQAQTGPRCFGETNLCIEGRIREYWEQNGGLAIFGFPITPQITEMVGDQPRAVQWFERNRLELHPENAPPYDVLLGRLGVDALEMQGRTWFAFPKSEAQEGCRYFPETGHNLCEPFLSVWRTNGLEFDGRPGTSEAESLALFGMPISDKMRADGSQALDEQWFERARFEYHPNNPDEYKVLLGLLGNEVRGGQVAQPDAAGVQMAFTSLRGGNQDVYLCTMAADYQSCGGEIRLTNIAQNDGQPTWAPNGTQIAFESDLDGDWEVYSINANGSGQIQHTYNDVIDGAPSWADLSGLGWRIAFHSNRDGAGFDVYFVDSEDPNNLTRLTDNPADDRHPALSPDGGYIAFASNRDGAGADIYVARLARDGGSIQLADVINLTQALGGDSSKPTWAPDNSRILFENTQEGNTEIYVVAADGSGGLQNLTSHEANDGHPGWAADQSKIVFHSDREGGVFSIYIMNADGSNPIRLISHAPAGVFHPTLNTSQ
jgi:Tol biopolymer transport system component